MKRNIFIMMMSAMLLLMSGCQREEKDLRDPTFTVTFTGMGMELEYTLEELYELPLEEIESTRLTSTGETIVSMIKGINISYFLDLVNRSISDVGSIRLIANDGYLAEVPRELLGESKLFIVLEENGKFLDHEDEIVKSGLIDERSLYWVRLLSRVEFTEPLPERSFTSWYFDTSIVSSLTPFDFDVFIHTEQAIYTLDLLNTMGDDSAVIVMTAEDGLTKVERRKDLESTVIVLSGESKPMFTAKDIAKGREVKYLYTLDTLSSRVIFTEFLEESFLLSSILGEDVSEIKLVSSKELWVNPDMTTCKFSDGSVSCEYNGQLIENVSSMVRP